MDAMVEQVDNCSISKLKLLDTWTLWTHLPHDTNWDLDSYKEISNISSIEEATTLLENLPETIIKNCNGGCFSYKINNKFVNNTWKKLSYVLLGETLTCEEYSHNITGITISPKKNFCIVKIWFSNCDNIDPNIIIDIDGLSKQGCLFKKHINDS